MPRLPKPAYPFKPKSLGRAAPPICSHCGEVKRVLWMVPADDGSKEGCWEDMCYDCAINGN